MHQSNQLKNFPEIGIGNLSGSRSSDLGAGNIRDFLIDVELNSSNNSSISD